MQASFGLAFGRLVRKKRGIEGLSQQELATLAFGNAAGKAKISQLENGRVHNPHQKTIDSLTIALEISDIELSECFTGIQPEKEEPQKGPFFRPIDPQEFSVNIVGRRLQFALDVMNREQLKKFSIIAGEEKVDFLEVGDPVFQKYGMSIISEIKHYAPRVPIIAEFASSDWIEQQVKLAAESGEDIVQVIVLYKRCRLRFALNY